MSLLQCCKILILMCIYNRFYFIAKSGRGIITPESRLGAAMIILSGGRIMESMRTHGLAKNNGIC